MHRLGTRGFDRFHHLINNNVGLVGWGWANVDCFIGHLHMQSLLIGIGIDGDSTNTHFASSFDNTAGDLATVSDQDFIEHVMSFSIWRDWKGIEQRKNPPHVSGTVDAFSCLLVARRRCFVTLPSADLAAKSLRGWMRLLVSYMHRSAKSLTLQKCRSLVS